MGPYGPLWAPMGPILLGKSLLLIKNDKIVNKIIKSVKSLKKIFPWFCDKDLSAVILLSRTHDVIKNINLFNKTNGLYKK